MPECSIPRGAPRTHKLESHAPRSSSSIPAPHISSRLIYRNPMAGADSASCQTSLTAGPGEGKQLMQQQGNPCLSISGHARPFTPYPGEKKEEEEVRRRCRLQAPSWHHPGSQESQEGDTRGHIRVCTGRESPGGDASQGKAGSYMGMMGAEGSHSAAGPCPSVAPAPTNTRFPAQSAGRGCSELRAHQAAWEAVGVRTSVPVHSGHGTPARLACGPGTGKLQSSISDLHLPAPRVAQDLFHHLEKSIYCQ